MVNTLLNCRGGCLCGAVAFVISGDVSQFHQCHCRRCRKSTGTAHASNIFTTPKGINWLSGELSIARYELPGAKFYIKAFCSHCGSPVPVISKNGKVLVVPAGSLESPIDFSPDDNVFWASRAEWTEPGRRAVCFDEFPVTITDTKKE